MLVTVERAGDGGLRGGDSVDAGELVGHGLEPAICASGGRPPGGGDVVRRHRGAAEMVDSALVGK